MEGVMHTGLKNPVPAVAAIILRGDEILLIRRGCEPGIGKWSVPGGSVEIGETLEEAVKREVREETGLEIEVGELAGVSDLIAKRDGELQFHYVLIDYLAAVTHGEAVAATDAAECRWVRLDEIGAYDVTKTLLDRLRENGLI
jgi:8-oxo-dGTP diphosphatase